jgi:class 3 adenylate cyclase
MSRATEPLAFIATENENGVAGMRLPIAGPSFSIGRDGSNNLCVSDDQTISRQHCVIHVVGASLIIEDLSRNGTFLDGTRVTGVSPLPIPSSVAVGHTQLRILPRHEDISEVTSAIESPFADANIGPPPSLTFREDAFLVVDIVNSTRLVQTDGHYFAKLTLAMGRALERSQKGEPAGFLKCTGDGYFACFSRASRALDAGTKLGLMLSRDMPVNVQLSVALHWGIATLVEQNDRVGNNVHAVFSLEQLRHNEPMLLKSLQAREPQIVLMTEPFWGHLAEAERALTQPLGIYPLKGIEDGIRVFRWKGPVSPDQTIAY